MVQLLIQSARPPLSRFPSINFVFVKADGFWFPWVEVLEHYFREGRYSLSLVCVLLSYISFKMGTNHIAFYFLLEIFPEFLQFGIADLVVGLLLLGLTSY